MTKQKNMTKGDETKCNAVRDAVESAGILESESEVEYATKFAVALGASKAELHVFTTGEIHVEGADSALKTWCEQLEDSIENDSDPPGVLLPEAVEEVAPVELISEFPAGDDVVQWYYSEAVKYREAGNLAGAAMLLAAASERALLMLIETYAARVTNETHRKKFLGRTTDRTILAQCEKLRQSYKRATSNPVALPAVEEFDKSLKVLLSFCQHVRDGEGRPSVISDPDAAAALAKIDSFPDGLEKVYELVRFLNANKVTV